FGDANAVLIRVAAAGICRTDLYVAEGRLPVSEPRRLGHEFSGTVEAVGAAVRRVAPGDRVTALPWLSCGNCAECRRPDSRPYRCRQARMLGVEADGAFTGWIALPEEIVYRLPASLPFLHGAYAEPVAASLAVLNAPLPRDGRGVLYGDNRIARLTLAVLRASGFQDLTLYDPGLCGPEPEPGSYDWAIETLPTPTMLDCLIRAVRPGGQVVLKSRPSQPTPLDIRAAVLKDLTFCAVNYGDFEAAIALLAGGHLELADLLGPVFPLEQWVQAFAAAGDPGGAEVKKCFLQLDPALDLRT
ncbi:MAG: L-threonine 3-dehydrogenase, partial [SAR202 cluster bacterium]|nr:L-threonine 3-dehydrogenase [SAR202 cluster bacterium]